MTSRGFISLPIVIAAVLGLGFGASVYLNYAQHQRAEQDKKLLQGEITDLRYQIDQDRQSLASSPSPSPSDALTPSPIAEPSASPSSSPAPAVAGTASIRVSQLGVTLTATDPIADLTYAPQKSGSYTVAAFTTQSLLAKYPACRAGALGSLVRKLKSVKPNANNKLIKSLGSYNYYYLAPAGNCATDTAGRNTVAAAKAALINGALPTLAN